MRAPFDFIAIGTRFSAFLTDQRLSCGKPGNSRFARESTPMSTTAWAIVLGDASHALKPLFEAYASLRREGDQWLDEALAEFGEEALELRKVYDGVQRGNIYAVAACIAVLASNISRFYAARVLGDEYKARLYGSDVNGKPFGEILRLAGNATRHNPPTKPSTVQPLRQLGITALDDTIPYKLLELAGIRSFDDLVRELDIFASQIDFKKTYDPSNPPKLEPWMVPFCGTPLPPKIDSESRD